MWHDHVDHVDHLSSHRERQQRELTVTLTGDYVRMACMNAMCTPLACTGYAGVNAVACTHIGRAKAFGLPVVLCTTPKTPGPGASRHESKELYDLKGWTLSDGFGPIGKESKHKFGPFTTRVNKAFEDRERMEAALEGQRELNGPGTTTSNGGPWYTGKRAPFDFVPNEGLVAECNVHTDGQYPWPCVSVDMGAAAGIFSLFLEEMW